MIEGLFGIFVGGLVKKSRNQKKKSISRALIASEEFPLPVFQAIYVFVYQVPPPKADHHDGHTLPLLKNTG